MRYGEIKSRSEKAQNRERGEMFSSNFEFGRGIEREKQWGEKKFGIKLKIEVYSPNEDHFAH